MIVELILLKKKMFLSNLMEVWDTKLLSGLFIYLNFKFKLRHNITYTVWIKTHTINN